MKNKISYDSIHSFEQCFSQFAGQRLKVLISSILKLVTQGVNLFESYLIAMIMDSLYGNSTKQFTILIISALILGVIAIVSNYISDCINIHVRFNVVNKLKVKAIGILWKRNNERKNYSVGEQHSIIQEDCEAVVAYVYQIISYLFSIIIIGYIGITLFSISIKWAGIFTIVQIIIGVIQQKGTVKIKKKAKECLMAENEFEKYLNEELNEIHAIRFENLRERVMDFVSKNLGEVKRKRIKQGDYIIYITSTSKLLMYVGKIVLFFGMGTDVLQHNISMKEFIVFYSYMMVFTSNFLSIVQMYTSLQPTYIKINRLLSILNTEYKNNMLICDYGKKSRLQFETIEFIEVTKKYGEKILFSQTNIKLDLRYSYALVGKNGSGKTTFTKMLLGEEKVSKGKILIDKENVEQINFHDCEEICYFGAKPCTLSGMTIVENLLLGTNVESIKKEDLMKICEDFFLLKDIKEMKNGFDTVLGTEVNLSSGQMKKIQLIRALLCEASVIIIDEPLANLDSEFKANFTRLFEKYFKSKKIIIVEHDEWSVPYVDCILKISDNVIYS